MAKTGPVVLLVEDSPDDVVLARFAIDTAELNWRVFPVRDGQDAVHYLSGESHYSDRKQYPLPSLVILDLKMPRFDGFAVLEWIQNQSDCERIPRIVLSSSSLDSDIARAKSLGADDYLVKPTSNAELVKLFLGVDARWLRR